MTPGKHGPHNYPWSFVRFQCPRTSANTTSGKQYYQYITNLILHILYNIMLHRLLKNSTALLNFIQGLLSAIVTFNSTNLIQKGFFFLSGLSWAGRILLCQLACWWYTWWHRSYSLYHVPCLCKWLSTLHLHYFTFSRENVSMTKYKRETLLAEIKQWMSTNILKLNDI